MGRYSEHDRALVDGIVDRWREDCLIHDGSLLYAGEHVWTPELVEELYRHFNLDLQEDHERGFEEKFVAEPRPRTPYGAARPSSITVSPTNNRLRAVRNSA